MRRYLGILKLAIPLIALFVLASVGVSGAGNKASDPNAAVIDGDTLQIGDATIQLWGIDAPELGQTCLNQDRRWRCGLDAAYALKKAVGGAPVECEIRSRGSEGPSIGVCRAGTKDLAEALLLQGYAVAAPDGPPGYLTAQDTAKTASLGLWRGAFIEPWEWRKGARLPETPDQPNVVCDIKGVGDAQGRRIYYVPTDENYEKIEVDTARGDRMLCSDDQARLNGWKRPPRR